MWLTELGTLEGRVRIVCQLFPLSLKHLQEIQVERPRKWVKIRAWQGYYCWASTQAFDGLSTGPRVRRVQTAEMPLRGKASSTLREMVRWPENTLWVRLALFLQLEGSTSQHEVPLKSARLNPQTKGLHKPTNQSPLKNSEARSASCTLGRQMACSPLYMVNTLPLFSINFPCGFIL